MNNKTESENIQELELVDIQELESRVEHLSSGPVTPDLQCTSPF